LFLSGGKEIRVSGTPEAAEAWKRGPLAGNRGGPEIMFGQVREDTGLECVFAKGDALCIASGGDTAFALFLAGAETVTAVDINAAQLYLVELKIAAFEILDYPAFLKTMTEDARAEYPRLRPRLSPEAQAHFDARSRDLSFGLQNCGKVDQAIRRLVRLFHWTIYDQARTRLMLTQTHPPMQRQIQGQLGDKWQWRFATSVLFSRPVLRQVFGSVFASAVPDGFATVFRNEIDRVLRDVPTASNPYAWQAFRGEYPAEALPAWLTEPGYRKVADCLPSLVLKTADIRQCLDRSYDLICLSNILDGTDAAYRQALASDLARSLKPDAVAVSRSFFPTPSELGTLSGGALRLEPTPEWTDHSFFCRFVEIFRRPSSSTD